MSTLNFNVNGDPHGDQPSLEPFDGNVPLQSHFEGNPPNRFVATVPGTISGGARLLYQNRTKEIRVILPPGDGSWEASDPPCRPPEQPDPNAMALRYSPPVVKLATSGRDFVMNGARWIWKGSSDFRAYEWFLQGRDLTPIFQQRQAAGANLLRVFGMYNGGIGRFIPSDYGNTYFDSIPGFCYAAGQQGFQIEWTAMADCQTFLSNEQQQAYWAQFGSVVQGIPNLVVELANEYKKNGVDPGRFSAIPGILCSRGSGLSDEAGYLPGWQFHTWHGRRDWPKVLFSAEDMWYVGAGYGWDMQSRPIVHDEPIGFDEVEQPVKRSTDPYVARVLGQTGSAYGAGATFHSSAGIQSDLWGPTTETCARAFYEALR